MHNKFYSKKYAYGLATALTVLPFIQASAQDIQRPPAPGTMLIKPMPQHIPIETGFPAPSTHTGQAHAADENYTSKWTRADARQIKAMSNPNAPTGANSLPTSLTMPTIPQNFPITNGQIWVWDTWPLTDAAGNQYSYNGWEVIFCLTAHNNAGYDFGGRHVHARIGYFYRKAGLPASARPASGGWIYGGNLFPDGSSAALYAGQEGINAQWSGSTRITRVGTNGIMTFYTDMLFPNNGPTDATITLANGQIHADTTHVWFTGFDQHIPLLKPDGYYYQTREQNPFMSFRDPYTFNDPANPGKTYMLFAGNSSGVRGNTPCDASDLGYQPGDQYAESVDQVNSSPAIFNRANVGLAVATKNDLTEWKFLPPLISANCTNDQLERPQMYMQNGDYYLMTISHRFTFASGLDGPDGEYGFYGHGIRSEWIPLNASSGLVLGNPTNLQIAAGADWALNPEQNLNTYQTYAHYVMPGGKVQSFIDMVQYRWGGSLAPIVHLNFQGPNTAVDMQYGQNGLGGYGDISANIANTNIAGMMQDIRSSSNRR